RMKATMASRAGKPWSCFGFTYPLALPALFFAGALVGDAGFAAEVLTADETGARALLIASDFGLAAAFFAAAFLAGLAAASPSSLSFLAGFAAFVFLTFLPPPLAARSSISAIASASVTSSGVLSLG